jgi:anthranilate phosphoribosyltransferase
MTLVRYIKEIAHARDCAHGLTEVDAYELFAAMLDGGVSELEIGAALTALRMKGESLPELLGFYRAMSERAHALRSPAFPVKPVVLATYSGARLEANLLPLLALILQRLGVPVLLHGTMESSGRVVSAYILRELGILPCATVALAQKALDEGGLAFVPTAVLCPAVAVLLGLRNRLGVSNIAHTMVRVLDPFRTPCVRVVSAADAMQLGRFEAFLAATGIEALLLKGTEGEPFADPRRRPRMVHFKNGGWHTLFEDEPVVSHGNSSLPVAPDAAATAQWIRLALNGRVPIPQPLVNQVACCLFVSGYTEDMNQAKAIAAVEAGALTTSARPLDHGSMSVR